MRKAELLPEARRLSAQGLSPREIAERLGLTTATVGTWLSAAQAAYRLRNEGVCMDCGGATSGANGPARALRCDRCQRNWQTLNRWNRERVIEAFHRWAVEHPGVHPSADVWNASRTPGGASPCAATAQKVFGSWSAALHAAGVEPYEPGPSRELREEIRRRYEQASQRTSSRAPLVGPRM